MRFSRITALAAAIGVFLWIFQGSAIAAANISNSPSWGSHCPRIAVDSEGNIHVVWAEVYSDSNETGDVFYSRNNAGTDEWTEPVKVSMAGRAYCLGYMICALDVDESGRVYVIWSERSSVKLRVFSGTSWGEPVTLDTYKNELATPRIGVTAAGDIFTIWWAGNGVVRSRAKVGGNWENVRTISAEGNRSKFADIAVGGGMAYACWVERRGDVYQAAYCKRTTTYNASWSNRDFVHPSNYSDQHPVVTVDSDGVAHIVWTPLIGSSRIVKYVHWTGYGFGTPVAISYQQMIHYASVCDQNGVIYACWQVGGYGGGRRVEFNFGQGTEWAGVGEVPNSAGGTLTDIAVSPDGGQIYIVWDGNGEIIFSTPEGGGGPPPNELPVASFTFSPETGEYPLEVTFDASSSYDPDGSVVGYEWNFGDGGTGQGKIVKHTYREKATFTIRLTVKDDRGATGSISQRIKVIKPNVLPVAAFTFSPARGLYPLTVTFDASSSHDPDGAIAHYYWDFGDGETGRGKITTHTYQNKGTYSIELTVDDYRAGTDTKVKSLTVLSLKQPLNIHWQTFKDESLFQIRYVTQVDWERNPENDPIAEVVTYRIYRKAPQEPVSAYRVISEVNAQTFTYRDYDISGENQYVYTVTALDGLGHESPIEH